MWKLKSGSGVRPPREGIDCNRGVRLRKRGLAKGATRRGRFPDNQEENKPQGGGSYCWADKGQKWQELRTDSEFCHFWEWVWEWKSNWSEFSETNRRVKTSCQMPQSPSPISHVFNVLYFVMLWHLGVLWDCPSRTSWLLEISNNLSWAHLWYATHPSWVHTTTSLPFIRLWQPDTISLPEIPQGQVPDNRRLPL